MSRDATDPISRGEQSEGPPGTACCAEVPEIEEDTVVADVQLLSALGNDTRYELVRRIRAAESDVCVCDLEAGVGLSQSAVSQTLSRLYSAGPVSEGTNGRWRLSCGAQGIGYPEKTRQNAR